MAKRISSCLHPIFNLKHNVFWFKNLRYLKGALPTVINYIFRTISVWHCLSSFPSFRKNNSKNNIVYPLFYNRKKKCHLLGLRNIRHSQNIGAILVALCLNDVTPRQKIKSTRLHVFLNVLLKRKKKKKRKFTDTSTCRYDDMICRRSQLFPPASAVMFSSLI